VSDPHWYSSTTDSLFNHKNEEKKKEPRTCREEKEEQTRQKFNLRDETVKDHFGY
jgi:hypothetical protein